MILQTGDRGKTKPREISLGVCHIQLWESSGSWSHKISQCKEHPLKLETVSQKQNDKSVENKHMAEVTPDVQDEDAYTNSKYLYTFPDDWQSY